MRAMYSRDAGWPRSESEARCVPRSSGRRHSPYARRTVWASPFPALSGSTTVLESWDTAPVPGRNSGSYVNAGSPFANHTEHGCTDTDSRSASLTPGGGRMNNEEREDTTVYKVVVNHEEQYSIWPSYRENPLGWRDEGKTGLKAECLAHIAEI